MSADAPAKSTGESGATGPRWPIPRPAWWLPGPHLPTIYGKLVRKIALPLTTREQWRLPDGDSLSVERMRGQPNAPRLVLFHGLEGGMHSTYARGILCEASRRGWWADFVLWRTCDGTLSNAVRRTYHSGASDDADFALERIVNADPDRPTVLAGISLGGNILLKWLGERATGAPNSIRAAAAISVPFDLAAASRKIERGFSKVYTRFFLKALKAKAFAKLARFPDIASAGTVKSARTMWEFDDAVTAPMHGFADAADYYKRSSSMRFLSEVRVRTLLFSAINDPFLPRSVFEEVRAIAARNPYLECVFPSHGGHVGFITGPHPWRVEYWMERFILDWLGAKLEAFQASRP